MGTRLQTQRLILEPLAPEHGEALFRIYRDPLVARFLISRPRSREEFLELFDRALRFGQSHGMWAVIPEEGGSVVGRLGFFEFGPLARPELAFLLSASVWGRGYATEACQGVLRHALGVQPWREVVAVVRPGNGPAIRVLRKLGLSAEAEIALAGEPAVLYGAARKRLRAALRADPARRRRGRNAE